MDKICEHHTENVEKNSTQNRIAHQTLANVIRRDWIRRCFFLSCYMAWGCLVEIVFVTINLTFMYYEKISITFTRAEAIQIYRNGVIRSFFILNGTKTVNCLQLKMNKNFSIYLCTECFLKSQVMKIILIKCDINYCQMILPREKSFRSPFSTITMEPNQYCWFNDVNSIFKHAKLSNIPS